jgi:hypothetical protein
LRALIWAKSKPAEEETVEFLGRLARAEQDHALGVEAGRHRDLDGALGLAREAGGRRRLLERGLAALVDAAGGAAERQFLAGQHHERADWRR